MSNDMENLLAETLRSLNYGGKSPADVRWVGSKDGTYAITWEQFEFLAADLDYDSGYGGSEIAGDLAVVGDDWWLERHEYDGSEWWEFKQLPVRSEKPIKISHLRSGGELYETNVRETDV